MHGFVAKKSMKSEEDVMILRMQEHHNTVSAKRTIGVEKGAVCGFLYLVKTVIAQQSPNLTRFQGFSLKMGRGWRTINWACAHSRSQIPPLLLVT